jgi:hypothetical protein
MTHFEAEMILRVRKGEPIIDRCTDGYGFARQTAKDDGYWIRLRGGIECIFVSDQQLQEATEANGHFKTSSKPDPDTRSANRPARGKKE